MKSFKKLAIAAASVATIVVFTSLPSCKGRKMSNMEPTGDTVEVVIQQTDATDSVAQAPSDSVI